MLLSEALQDQSTAVPIIGAYGTVVYIIGSAILRQFGPVVQASVVVDSDC